MTYPLEVYVKTQRASPIPEEPVAGEAEVTAEPEESEPRELEADGSESFVDRLEEEQPSERSESRRPARGEEAVLPATNWYAAIDEVAQRTVADNYRLQESQSAVWRNSTRSVMIQRGEEFVAQEDAPVVDNFEFAVKSRVFGIGLNIGRCFFGIPIAGVPVEDRTGHITVFVCVRKP